MNRKKWFIIHLILWSYFWIVLGISHNKHLATLQENSLTFLFQIGLIALLIFVISPKLLVKKQYLLLGLVYLVTISSFSYTHELLTYGKRPPPPKGKPPPPREKPPPPREKPPPPRPGERKPPKKKGPSPEINVLAGSLLLGFTYLFTLLMEGIQFTQQQEKLVIQSKNAVLESELKFLKSNINPHFLFNSLNNIYALSAIDSTKTRQSIGHLSKILRYVLYDCENAYVSPQKEIEYIHKYIELFALKNLKKLPIQITSQINDATVLIAPMLLIPFVENALKHSYIESVENSFIRINFTVSSDSINFKVENSIPKVAINKDQTGGIGLKNVQKRLAILYPNKHLLELDEQEDIYKVKLKIDVR